MQRYIDTVRNSQGAPIPGAFVSVSEINGDLVSLYQSDGITQIENPVETDAVGMYSFYAPDGDYTLTISAAGYAVFSENIRLGSGPSPLTNTQLRAAPVPISGTVAISSGSITATGALTNAELRASAVPISGSITVNAAPVTAVTGTFWQVTQPVSFSSVPTHAVTGPLTNAELRSSSISVTGPITNTELRAAAVPISGSVSVSSVPVTAVTGTFWQAIQPISGTVAVTGAYQATQPVSIASMPTTEVTGSFYQATQPVSGTFWQGTQPVSGPVTDAQLRATPVPISGAVSINSNPPSLTGTQSSVASGTSDVTILPSNAVRKGATVFNDDANALYLLLSSGTSSSTNFTVSLPGSGGYYEVPYTYTGVIKGSWAANGSGSARVTEFT